MKNKLNTTLFMLILLCITLGCIGPSADADRCEGIVEFKGKTYEGASKTEEQAELNACNRFCLETDAEFDAMYGIWLTGAKAKSMEERTGQKPSKFDAMMEDKKLLDYVTKNCAPKCVKEANKKDHTLETKCRD